LALFYHDAGSWFGNVLYHNAHFGIINGRLFGKTCHFPSLSFLWFHTLGINDFTRGLVGGFPIESFWVFDNRDAGDIALVDSV
jgi:hypothetical protein